MVSDVRILKRHGTGKVIDREKRSLPSVEKRHKPQHATEILAAVNEREAVAPIVND